MHKQTRTHARTHARTHTHMLLLIYVNSPLTTIQQNYRNNIVSENIISKTTQITTEAV